LNTCENIIIAGLNDRAFLVQDSAICELLAPENGADKKHEPPKGAESKHESSKPATEQKQQQQNVPNANEVQAVAVVCFDNHVWCAISRYNKTLSLYCLTRDTSFPSNIQPTTVHKTVKRVLCVDFGNISSENPSSSSLHVVIAGDLVGDATAYSLTDSEQSKVLLGHTASMLTGLDVVSSHILTCDRDEKIRVSCFPQTFVIEGYLLGHTAFITSMDATADDKCVSCGGDGTVRLWNYVECKQLAEYNTEQWLPTKVAISPSGEYVAVIYDASNKLDVLSTRNGASLESQQSIECPLQPLSIKFVSNDRILVLTCDPEYLLEYKPENEQFAVNASSSAVQALKQVATPSNIIMPTTIMEIDEKSGQIKLQKEAESRGAKAGVKPWNKVERIQKAKEAGKRRGKRRRIKGQDDEGEEEDDEE